MRAIYTAIYYFIIPFVLIRLLWRSRRMSNYRKRWHERFAHIKPFPDGKTIWIHAVSVGETLAAIPLVESLIKRYQNEYRFVITTTTPTGSDLVMQKLGNQVYHVYAPFDLPHCVNRFLKRARIHLCIIMETEMWPNLLTICQKQSIPIILANARLSEQSSKRYQLIHRLMKQMLSAYHTIAAQGVLDGERYLQLGLEPKKLVVTGNIKFDIDIPNDIIQQGKKIREQIGLDRRVLIAASTHDGEESIIMNAFKKIQKEIPSLFLILVPRHPDRTQKIEDLCRQHKLSFVTRTQSQPITATTDALLVDTIGELLMIYSAADIAFVGGSLVPVGGHNLIEPAALGLPILTGPHLHNFTQIAKLLQQAGAAQIVTDSSTIADAVIGLCSAKELREKIGKCAQETIYANRGALQKHLECIERCLQ